MPPVQQLRLEEAPAPSPPARPPIVLSLGPCNWGIATWTRDERDVPVYRITQRDIRAASTAATMARQVAAGGGQG